MNGAVLDHVRESWHTEAPRVQTALMELKIQCLSFFEKGIWVRFNIPEELFLVCILIENMVCVLLLAQTVFNYSFSV